MRVMHRLPLFFTATLAVALLGVTAVAQTGTITVITSGDNVIVRAGETIPVDAVTDLSDRIVYTGDAVETSTTGTATLHFSEYRTSAGIQASSKLLLENTPAGANDIALTLHLERGTVVLSRKTAESGQVALAAGSGSSQGYVLVGEGIVLATYDGTNVEFSSLAGTATYFQGTPGTPTAAGVPVAPGMRIAPGERPQTADTHRADAALTNMAESRYAFGVERGDIWLTLAEEGDFTPVKEAGAPGTPSLVGTEFAPTQAFDQPTQLAVVTAPQATTIQSLRTVVSPGTGLVQSGVPGSVIAGQRFRRSIIIGNPGTAGTGPITINPSAELLIRIAGR